MSEAIARCPRCGKRRNPESLTCPVCGFEFLPRTERIRCSHCGYRVLADSPECPRCGADPRAGRLASLRILPRVVAAFAALLLFICLGWVVVRALSTNTLERVLGMNTPTPTRQPVQVVYVVATVPPPTATTAATPTPLPPAIPTKAVAPSPTRRGARTATPTRIPPTATPSIYPAPQLTGPPNTTVYNGADANIVLAWQPVAPAGLGEQEWYRIWISYTGKDGKPAQNARWTKETAWTVPPDYWGSASAESRGFSWSVTAVRIQGVDPFASPNYSPVSLPSATRSFFWH